MPTRRTMNVTKPQSTEPVDAETDYEPTQVQAETLSDTEPEAAEMEADAEAIESEGTQETPLSGAGEVPTVEVTPAAQPVAVDAEPTIDPITGIHQCNHALVGLLYQLWCDPIQGAKNRKALERVMGENYPVWETTVNQQFAQRRVYEQRLVDAAINGH